LLQEQREPQQQQQQQQQQQRQPSPWPRQASLPWNLHGACGGGSGFGGRGECAFGGCSYGSTSMAKPSAPPPRQPQSPQTPGFEGRVPRVPPLDLSRVQRISSRAGDLTHRDLPHVPEAGSPSARGCYCGLGTADTRRDGCSGIAHSAPGGLRSNASLGMFAATRFDQAKEGTVSTCDGLLDRALACGDGPAPSAAVLSALLGEGGGPGVDDREIDDLTAPSAVASFWAPVTLPFGSARGPGASAAIVRGASMLEAEGFTGLELL